MRRRRIVHASDRNQPDIVKGLRDIPDCTVDIIGEPLDLLVGYQGRNYLLEVKADYRSPLRPSQVEFFREWKGQKARVHTLLEAKRAIGAA